MANYLDAAASQLRLFEATISWMYLDSRGNVTVGVGFMLPNAAAALKFNFVSPIGKPSTDEEITADFLRVKHLSVGRIARYYYSSSAPALPLTDITMILDAAVGLCDAELAKTFDKYASFRDAAKLALIDMDYNLGHEKLVNAFAPHFCPAVARMDWATAAAHCHRIGPDEIRNEWTRQQFLKAAEEESCSSSTPQS